MIKKIKSNRFNILQNMLSLIEFFEIKEIMSFIISKYLKFTVLLRPAQLSDISFS